MEDTREKSEFEKYDERYEQGKKLTAVELAETMLEYSKKLKELQALEATIKRSVLDLGKTQTVGDIRATFSKGRRSCDYQKAVIDEYQSGNITHADYAEIIDVNTKTVIDWRGVCSLGKIDASDYFEEIAGPGVSIKQIK